MPIDLTKVTHAGLPAGVTRGPHRAVPIGVQGEPPLFRARCGSCWPGSGHIAGVINPPGQAKYQYWVNPPQDGHVGELADWLAGAEEHPGSWWPDWDAWLAPQVRRRRSPAREPGEGGLAAIEDAPGSYVKMRG